MLKMSFKVKAQDGSTWTEDREAREKRQAAMAGAKWQKYVEEGPDITYDPLTGRTTGNWKQRFLIRKSSMNGMGGNSYVDTSRGTSDRFITRTVHRN